jgi:hypothetical protein
MNNNNGMNAYREGYEQGWKDYLKNPRMMRSWATNGTPEGDKRAANFRQGQLNGRKNRTNGKTHKYAGIGGMLPKQSHVRNLFRPTQTLRRGTGNRNLLTYNNNAKEVLSRQTGSRVLVPFNENAYGPSVPRQEGKRNLFKSRRNRRNRRN